jgi:hypothetical protein
LASADFGLRFSREVVFWDLAKAIPPKGVGAIRRLIVFCG